MYGQKSVTVHGHIHERDSDSDSDQDSDNALFTNVAYWLSCTVQEMHHA